MPTSVLIKIGGSLINSKGGILNELGSIISQYTAQCPVYIVPGGGPFADQVRQYGKKFRLSDETCHFMALSAMDQYAYLLKEFIPGSRLTDLSDSTFEAHCVPTTPQILLCSHFLRHIPADSLPRSWDVTSDSVAAYLARQLNVSLLLLIKSTDIDPEIKMPDVDVYFKRLLPLNCPTWFINGLYPERLSRLLQTGTVQGITIPPNSLRGQSVL